jgi:Fur family peroxide stress response transcriptional regulator
LKNYSEILRQAGLKVTPQRITVLSTLNKMKNHPTVEQISNVIRKDNPSIALGTIYNILETLASKNIIGKVKTSEGAFRYDPIVTHHHHIFYVDSDRIEDYFDEELNKILENYFTHKKIPGFQIKNVRLQIIGKSGKHKKSDRKGNTK